LGNYKKDLPLTEIGITPPLSSTRFSIQRNIFNNEVNEHYNLISFDSSENIYMSNYNTDTGRTFTEKIDQSNLFLLGNAPGINQATVRPSYNTVVKNTFNTNNYNYMLSFAKPRNPIPAINFKLRLNNRLNFEDALIFEPSYPTEFLSKGWHHFAVTFDSVNGKFLGYVDSRLIFSYDFLPNKYSYSTILRSNLLVGTAPYYNNVDFNNFYRSLDVGFYAQNIKMQNVNFYNKVLNTSEIKMLGFEKFEPSDLKLQLNFGERNFIDNIKRVMKQKISGKKSPFINIIINDSLITDASSQKYYETVLLSELKEVLPPYIKINKIEWISNKPSREQITQNDINIGNTLTDSGGLE
jgi:hypothetical protein